jgi:hypothetical protein
MNWKQHLGHCALIACGALFVGCSAPAPGVAAPRVTVVDLEGLKTELPRALGKGTLVSLWAMW